MLSLENRKFELPKLLARYDLYNLSIQPTNTLIPDKTFSDPLFDTGNSPGGLPRTGNAQLYAHGNAGL